MGRISQHLVPTAWGPVRLERSERGLTRVRLPDPGAGAETLRADDPPAGIEAWAGLLVGYFNGEPTAFDTIPLDEAGLTPLEAAIYRALRQVGYGETTTYGELAARVGLPGGARAVGTAMARNPWPVVVPCHRVLAKGGALHGFSAPGGVSTKRRLLAMEGVDLDRGAPLLPGLFDGA